MDSAAAQRDLPPGLRYRSPQYAGDEPMEPLDISDDTPLVGSLTTINKRWQLRVLMLVLSSGFIFLGLPFLWSQLLTVVELRRLSNRSQPCSTASCRSAADWLDAAIDFNTDRCMDPYGFACGSWLGNFTLKDDQRKFTRSFSTIRDDNLVILRQIVDSMTCEEAKREASANQNKSLSSYDIIDSWDAMLHCTYELCMDEPTLDTLGISPLLSLIAENAPYLLNVNYTRERTALSPSERRTVLSNRVSTISYYTLKVMYVNVATDLYNDGTYVMYVNQAPLGLSYRLFERDVDVAKYKRHIKEILMIFNKSLQVIDGKLKLPEMIRMKEGDEVHRTSSLNEYNSNLNLDIDERVDRILQMEKDLKSIMLTPEEHRDTLKVNNPITWVQLKGKLQAIDLDIFIEPFKQLIPYDKRSEFSDDTIVYVENVRYFERFSSLLSDKWTWDALHDYFLFSFITSKASTLGGDIGEERDRYYKDTSGADIKPRWKICLSQVQSWVISRRFVGITDAVRAKEITESMIDDLMTATKLIINNSLWMDLETKTIAIEKLSKMKNKISHPEWLLNDYHNRFTSYYGPPITYSDFFTTRNVIHEQAWNRTFGYYGKLKDPTIWHMLPQTVNAYYSPTDNEIVFPASILRRPFLYVWDTNTTLEDQLGFQALNYGGLGSVIAHEITHGFDDQGRHFDPDGRLRSWWTNSSAETFTKAAECFKEQYGNYSVDIRDEVSLDNETIHLSGELTLGENIADNGGLKLAWIAMHERFGTKSLIERNAIRGVDMTPVQLFFLSYSQIWCFYGRDDYLKRLVLQDPHSPGEFRVTGALHNFREYFWVSDCPNDRLGDRPTCTLW